MRLPLSVYSTAERRTTTPLELFFDLVFVVAVSRLGELLYEHHSAVDLLLVAGLLATVWWAWISFSWFADLFGDDDLLNRFVLLGAMLGACLIAVTVGDGVREDSAWLAATFAVLFAALACIYAGARGALSKFKEFWTYYAWGSAVGAACWVVSLAVPPPARYCIWGVGLVANMALSGPLAYHDARVVHPEQTSHMPERFACFTLIVLGETVLAVAIGLDTVGGGAPVIETALAGFVIACGVWWVYFKRFDADLITRALKVQTGTWNVWTFVYGYGHFFLYTSVLASGVALKLTLDTGDIVPLLGIANAGVVAALVLIWARFVPPPPAVLAFAVALACGAVIVSAGWLGVVPAMVLLASGWVAFAALVSAPPSHASRPLEDRDLHEAGDEAHDRDDRHRDPHPAASE